MATAATPRPTLYYSPNAIALVPHILFLSTSLPFSLEKFSAKDGLTDEQIKLNPKKLVPFMTIPSLSSSPTVITETIAIITWIAQHAPSHNVLGRSDDAKVRAYEYMSYIATTLHAQGVSLAFNAKKHFAEGTDPEDEKLKRVQASGRNIVRACYEYVEEKLEEGEWALGKGEDFSAADVYLYAVWRWGSFATVSRDGLVKYKALAERVAAKEEVKKACEVQEIAVLP